MSCDPNCTSFKCAITQTTRCARDDTWKDELLTRSRIAGVEFLDMPEEQREFIKKHKDVFATFTHIDYTYNLLHRDNKAILKDIKEKKGVKPS